MREGKEGKEGGGNKVKTNIEKLGGGGVQELSLSALRKSVVTETGINFRVSERFLHFSSFHS